jgi:hypothetical protein
MGKGKGSRTGVNAKIKAGVMLVGVSFSRFGLWSKFIRYIKSRCSFKVVSVSKKANPVLYYNGVTNTSGFVCNNYVKSHAYSILQRRCIQSKISELYYKLQRLEKLQLCMYFRRIFNNMGRYSLSFTIYGFYLSNFQAF